MTVNKEKWQEIAEKYNTKAKWAEALLMLNPEDHDDLISALIELDPQDLVGVPTRDIYVTYNNPPSSAGKLAEDTIRDLEAEARRRLKLANVNLP